MQAKTKVSISVRTTLLREVERAAGAMTRSAVFEQALAGWLRRHRQKQLDRAVDAYYRSLSAGERIEDEQWAALGDDAARGSWDRPKR